MRKKLHVVFMLISATSLLSCSTLKNLVTSKKKEEPSTTGSRFSEQDNLKPPTRERNYKRMTRRRFEDDAELGATAGSLWVMEGQGAYLFAQNQRRMVGDLLNVKIEGGPKSQLQGKVKVISKLLERLETSLQRGPASVDANPAAAAVPGQAAEPPAAPAGGAAAGANNSGNAQGTGEEGKKEPPFLVPVVPTRIVEQLRDGSYRVRGTQAFMIGRREYKVIVTGLVRSEDFDEAGVDASKLLDSQFDVVSAKKGATL